MGEDEPGCALRFAGFDVDMLPGGGAEDIREIAGEWPPDPLRDELLRRVAEGAAEAPEAAKAQLEEALRFCEEHETSLRALAGDSSGFVAEALRSLRDSLEMRAELEQQLRSLDPVRMYHALGKREQWMHRRVRWLLEERDPKAKIVLVGHNEHLALRRETLWLRRASEPRLSPKYVLGDLLGQTHPGEIFGIWMLFGGGRHFPHPMDPRPQTEIPPNAERVEHILASAGIPIYLLPLQDNDPGAEPLARPWDHWTGGMDHSCILREQCDAVFFVDRVREPIDRSDDA
jgi:erythromycin esterase-like protein